MFRSAELARYPHLVRDLGMIFVAALCGAGLASLFTWDDARDPVHIDAVGILLHNLSLAFLAVILSHYGAVIMMALNGFWLGMGLVASVAVAGLGQTVSLTVVHVPLEVLAWALTIQGARKFWPTLVATLRKKVAWVYAARGMLAVLALPVALYVLAALSEWAVHALLER